MSIRAIPKRNLIFIGREAHKLHHVGASHKPNTKISLLLPKYQIPVLQPAFVATGVGAIRIPGRIVPNINIGFSSEGDMGAGEVEGVRGAKETSATQESIELTKKSIRMIRKKSWCSVVIGVGAILSSAAVGICGEIIYKGVASFAAKLFFGLGAVVSIGLWAAWYLLNGNIRKIATEATRRISKLEKYVQDLEYYTTELADWRYDLICVRDDLEERIAELEKREGELMDTKMQLSAEEVRFEEKIIDMAAEVRKMEKVIEQGKLLLAFFGILSRVEKESDRKLETEAKFLCVKARSVFDPDTAEQMKQILTLAELEANGEHQHAAVLSRWLKKWVAKWE